MPSSRHAHVSRLFWERRQPLHPVYALSTKLTCLYGETLAFGFRPDRMALLRTGLYYLESAPIKCSVGSLGNKTVSLLLRGRQKPQTYLSGVASNSSRVGIFRQRSTLFFRLSLPSVSLNLFLLLVPFFFNFEFPFSILHSISSSLHTCFLFVLHTTFLDFHSIIIVILLSFSSAYRLFR